MSEEQVTELPKRLVIENKASGPIWEKQFFLDIQEAVINGYRLAENPYHEDCSMRNFMGHMGRAVMYLPGYEPLKGEPKGVARATSSLDEEPPVKDPEPVNDEGNKEPSEPIKDDSAASEDVTEPSVVEKLESLTKKKQLLEFAKEQEITVPEEMTVPSQIKKFLKDELDK